MKSWVLNFGLLICLALSTFAQTPGTSQFPTSLDTNTTLLTAVNGCSTTLDGAVTNSQTTFTVVSTACFPSDGVFALESELVIYTGKTSTTFTGLTRGAFSTSAVSHSNGIATRLSILAQYHNAVKAAIIAAQTKLGTGSATAAANQVLRGIGPGATDFGQITDSYVASGAAIAISKLNISGTPNGSKFLRDDGSWQVASGTGITALTGDVTASGSGSVAATIANNAVTFAKFQNINTARLLGRSTASTGNVEEISIGSGLSLSAGTLSATGGGSTAWDALTAPGGNLSLAMAANLTTLTYGSNFGASSAFKLVGANTSATGPLLHLSTGVSNNIPPLLIEPRGGQSFKADHLQSVYIGKGAIGNTDTDGYLYLPVIGSNLFPSGTPTTTSGFAPVVLESDGINGDYALWGYQGSAWRDLSGQRKRYDTGSGNGSQTIDFNSSTSAHIARTFTLSGGNATLSFNNPPKAGTLITIILVQDGTGSRTVTWPATVKWSGGTAPTLTTTAGKRDVFTFVYDGSNYYNTSQQLNQ